MAELDSLIRIRKHDIDQKQKNLAQLYRKAEELKNKRDKLETQLAIEAEKTKDMDKEIIGFFEPYAASVRAQIEEIDKTREDLEKRINIAQEDIRDAFAELKKIEIIQERRADEELADIKKKETDNLDEIAIDNFRRRDGN